MHREILAQRGFFQKATTISLSIQYQFRKKKLNLSSDTRSMSRYINDELILCHTHDEWRQEEFLLIWNIFFQTCAVIRFSPNTSSMYYRCVGVCRYIDATCCEAIQVARSPCRTAGFLMSPNSRMALKNDEIGFLEPQVLSFNEREIRYFFGKKAFSVWYIFTPERHLTKKKCFNNCWIMPIIKGYTWRCKVVVTSQ